MLLDPRLSFKYKYVYNTFAHFSKKEKENHIVEAKGPNQEHEILDNSTAEAIKENTPSCFWMLLVEMDCLKATPL